MNMVKNSKVRKVITLIYHSFRVGQNSIVYSWTRNLKVHRWTKKARIDRVEFKDSIVEAILDYFPNKTLKGRDFSQMKPLSCHNQYSTSFRWFSISLILAYSSVVMVFAWSG